MKTIKRDFFKEKDPQASKRWSWLDVSSCNSLKKHNLQFFSLQQTLLGIFWRVRDSYISYILKQPALLMLTSPIQLGNQASVPPDCCVEVLKSHVARWSVSPEGGHGKWRFRNRQIPSVSINGETPKSSSPTTWNVESFVCHFCKIPKAKPLQNHWNWERSHHHRLIGLELLRSRIGSDKVVKFVIII